MTRPFGFGVIAPAGKGSRWDVTVTDVTADGTSQVIADNQFNEVRDGWQYVVGRMSSALNTNLKASDVGKALSTSYVMPVFIGNDGKIYDIWNDNNAAVVLNDDWIGQDNIIAQVGVKSSGRFAIQVPTKAVLGGHLAVRNEVNQEITYFGDAL